MSDDESFPRAQMELQVLPPTSRESFQLWARRYEFASCYASVQPLQLFGRGPGRGNYLLLLTHRGPRFAPRPPLACHAPRMGLRQICRMLKVMKQVRNREAAAAARKQGSAAPAPASPGTKSEKKCGPSCLRHKRSLKRVG